MSRRPPTVSSLLAMCAAACLSQTALGGSAQEVFRRAAPSIVLIKDVESFGSGVVVRPTGLIVTNYHVVSSPLPREVRAQVIKDGRQTAMVFKDAKVVGVHPTYDLALIQVTVPADVQLIMAQKDRKTPLATGEACYAIGNPGGGAAGPLENTITSGIISTAARRIEGQTYIQTTAPINPGNSGGALVDKWGNIIGVVTFIITDTEGIGFAIPYAGLKRSVFKPLAERKVDNDKCVKLDKLGRKYHEMSGRLRGDQRKLAVAMACYCFRQAVIENPKAESPHHNCGLMYFQLEEYEVAEAYLSRAVELNPAGSSSYKMLGMARLKLGKAKEADETWRTGMLKTTDKLCASGCAENYAVSMINAKEYAKAAYCVKWADALADDPRRRTQRAKLFDRASQHLNDAQFQYLRQKKGGYSLEDFKRFAALKPGDRVTVAPPPKDPDPAPVRTPSVSPALTKRLKELVAGAPDPGEKGLKKRMPDEVTDAKLAYGGAYLVVRFKLMKKLGVFNIAQARFDKYLKIASTDVRYAAGGRYLVTYSPGDTTFRKYDLGTFQMAASRGARFDGPVTNFEMGLRNPDRAVVRYCLGKEVFSAARYARLDVGTLRTHPLTLPRATYVHWKHYRDGAQLRAGPDLKHIVAWSTAHSPSGFSHAAMTDNGISGRYQHGSHGALRLSDSGRVVFTSAGRVIRPDGKMLKEYKYAMLFPVYGRPWFVELEKLQTVRVREEDTGFVRNEFKMPVRTDYERIRRGDFTPDKVLHASGPINRLVVVNSPKMELWVWRLAPAGSGPQPGKGAAVRGRLWTRKLEYPKGTKVVVEDGPDGAAYDAATGSLKWRVPAAAKRGPVTLLLSITVPGREESYSRINVDVR